MLWYVAERIVRHALNRRYLNELKPYFAIATDETKPIADISKMEDEKSTIAEYVFYYIWFIFF